MEPGFDAAWRERALSGDADAIRVLADTALQPLYSFAFYRVGRKHELCEDVVQATMVKAIKDLSKYEPDRADNNIFGWLMGMARNEIRRVLTQQKSATSLEALWERMDKELLQVYSSLESDPFADEVLQREETKEMVNTTMSQLPPKYREALEAKYVQGKSVRDIAESNGATEKSIESTLTRARNAFRATFLALARNLQVEPGL